MYSINARHAAQREWDAASTVLNELEAIEIINELTPIIRGLRDELAQEFDVSEGSEHENFTGLCDIAIERLRKKLIEYGGKKLYTFIFNSIHGEQAHNPICPKEYWPLQHTWCSITRHGVTIYIDPTSSQFMKHYDDMPEFYISTIPPKWYYPDMKNPAFNGFTKILNQWRVTYPVWDNGERRFVRDGLIEFLQYEIWGPISDLIRKFTNHK